jgi:hypothetical protein
MPALVLGVEGGVLGNSEHPFGLVHCVLPRGILAGLEVHQSVAKPEQLAAVWQPPGVFEAVQEPINAVSDVTARRAVARATGFRVMADWILHFVEATVYLLTHPGRPRSLVAKP